MRRRVANVLLWLGATCGALSLVAAILIGALGYVPLVFTSGSMSPDITAGSLGIATTVPASELEVGDVVSVETSEGTRVTHRIVTVDDTGDSAVLTLQGDANDQPDAEPYTVSEADRVMFSVPWVGRVLTWLSSPIAFFVAGVLAAGVIFWIVSSARGRRRHDGDKAPGPARHVALALIAITIPGLSAVAPAQPTMAAFNDLGGTVTTSGFVTHRVAQPSAITCATSGLPLAHTNLTIGTTATDARYTYWVRIFDTAGNPITPYRQMAGAGTTRSYTYALLSGDLPLLGLGTTYHARVFAQIGSTTWESVDYRSQPISKTTVLVNCGAPDPAPVITFTRPVHGYSASSLSAHAFITGECDSNYGSTWGAACGTVTDNGSVAKVEYILQRTGGTLGVRCWNPDAFLVHWVSDCSFRPASRTGNRWSVPRPGGSLPYISDGSFTLTIRATDNLGNVSSSSVNFTVTY